MSVNRYLPNIGPRISILDSKGRSLAKLGDGFGFNPGQFIAPHGICVDSSGAIYLAEVSRTNMRNLGEEADDIRSLHKLTPC